MRDEREDSGLPGEAENASQDRPVETGSSQGPEASAGAEEAGQQPSEPEESVPSGPPPDVYSVLRFCLGLLIEQAWVHLGLHLAPGMTETQMDLPRARVAIDAAASIYEHLRPNADDEERRATELALTNLRVNFARKASQS